VNENGDGSGNDITQGLGYNTNLSYRIRENTEANNASNNGTEQAYIRDRDTRIDLTLEFRSQTLSCLKLLGSIDTDSIVFDEESPVEFQIEVQHTTTETLVFSGVVFSNASASLDEGGELSISFEGFAQNYEENTNQLGEAGVPNTDPYQDEELSLSLDGQSVAYMISFDFEIDTRSQPVYSGSQDKRLPVGATKGVTTVSGSSTLRIDDDEFFDEHTEGTGSPVTKRIPYDVEILNSRNTEKLVLKDTLTEGLDSDLVDSENDNEPRTTQADFVSRVVEVQGL
jgi:hypothetical protein